MNTSRLCHQETKAKIYWLTLVSKEHGWACLAPSIEARRGIYASSVKTPDGRNWTRALSLSKNYPNFIEDM